MSEQPEQGGQPVGGEVLQPQLLATGHWLPPLAQVIKLWTLNQYLMKYSNRFKPSHIYLEDGKNVHQDVLHKP